MKKIWTFISVFLLGVISGIVIAVKWLNTEIIEVSIRKVKNKNVSGSNSINIPVDVESPKKRSKRKIFKKK